MASNGVSKRRHALAKRADRQIEPTNEQTQGAQQEAGEKREACGKTQTRGHRVQSVQPVACACGLKLGVPANDPEILHFLQNHRRLAKCRANGTV